MAVAASGEQITYGQLNARANRLAHGLLALGVSAGTPVVVSLDRTPDLIVAILGILKAGGAYVPVDPTYPAERIAYICRDVGEDARAPLTIAGAPETWPDTENESNPET